MEDKVTYSIFDTSFGLCGIVLSKKGIVRFILPGMAEDELILRLRSGQVSAISHQSSAISCGKFGDIEDSIKRYFDGERVDFNFPLDLSCSTAFQRSVYKTTKTIPYGEVKTYKWVAKKIGLPHAYRAVGGALSRNPIPLLIPCHRVVREDGEMGGFTAPGGIDLKMKMLKMENINIYREDLSAYRQAQRTQRKNKRLNLDADKCRFSGFKNIICVYLSKSASYFLFFASLRLCGEIRFFILKRI